MAAQLTCTVANGPRSEWVNGASLFGELKDGYVFKVSVTQARQCFFLLRIWWCRLLDPGCDILQTIGSQIPYECAIGLNGFVSEQAMVWSAGVGEQWWCEQDNNDKQHDSQFSLVHLFCSLFLLLLWLLFLPRIFVIDKEMVIWLCFVVYMRKNEGGSLGWNW